MSTPFAHFGHGAMSDFARYLDIRSLRQNNPTGKIYLSPSRKSPLRLPPSCPRGRGVGHRHRTLGWDAVDAAVSGVKFVRRAVSVSGQRSAGRTMLKRTVKSCGPDASVVGVKSAEGKSA